MSNFFLKLWLKMKFLPENLSNTPKIRRNSTRKDADAEQISIGIFLKLRKTYFMRSLFLLRLSAEVPVRLLHKR